MFNLTESIRTGTLFVSHREQRAGYSHAAKTGGVNVSVLIMAFLLIVENVDMEKHVMLRNM